MEVTITMTRKVSLHITLPLYVATKLEMASKALSTSKSSIIAIAVSRYIAELCAEKRLPEEVCR